MPYRNSNSSKHICMHACRCVCACVHANWCVIKGSLMGETAKRLYNGCLLQNTGRMREWVVSASVCAFACASTYVSVYAGPLSQGSNSISAFSLPAPLPLPLPQSGSNSKVSLMNLHFCPIARRQRCALLFFILFSRSPSLDTLLFLRCSCRSMLSQRQ